MFWVTDLWFIALCFVSAKMAAAPAGLGSSSSRGGGGGGMVEGEMADFSPGGKCSERKLWASSGSCSAQLSTVPGSTSPPLFIIHPASQLVPIMLMLQETLIFLLSIKWYTFFKCCHYLVFYSSIKHKSLNKSLKKNKKHHWSSTRF